MACQERHSARLRRPTVRCWLMDSHFVKDTRLSSILSIEWMWLCWIEWMTWNLGIGCIWRKVRCSASGVTQHRRSKDNDMTQTNRVLPKLHRSHDGLVPCRSCRLSLPPAKKDSHVISPQIELVPHDTVQFHLSTRLAYKPEFSNPGTHMDLAECREQKTG